MTPNVRVGFWRLLKRRSRAATRRTAVAGRSSTRGSSSGVHERGSEPGDRFSLPYFPVTDLTAAVERVRELGGEIVHPGERWAICRDSEGTPFGLAGPP